MVKRDYGGLTAQCISTIAGLPGIITLGVSSNIHPYHKKGNIFLPATVDMLNVACHFLEVTLMTNSKRKQNISLRKY